MDKQIGILSVIAGSLIFSQASFGAMPVVTNVQMTQDPLTRLVTITYEVADASGIVTLDVQTNGVSIGAENIRYLHGDVNREVKIGSHEITWRPDKSWPGHKVDQATAKVIAWDKSAPPDYMTVELTEPYGINWYTCEGALPEGIESDYYRENVLLLRKICQPKGGVWVMGSPKSGEGWREPKREELHRVTLTNDYWIGVFEVTQKQWDLVVGGQPSAFQGVQWATRPVEQVHYNNIRGGDPQFRYPQKPDPASFLGKLRTKTGVQSFDLPSEMQWEYACRAGTGSALNNGAPVTNTSGKDPEMDKVGRYKDNGGMEENTARVGSYLPNAWGIYDMHGNVCEWCLDLFAENISSLDGAVNTVGGSARVRRGGGWKDLAVNCRSANRGSFNPSTPDSQIGFRIVCSLELAE